MAVGQTLPRRQAAGASSCRRAARCRTVVQARFGGGDSLMLGGNQNQRQKEARLILPGQPQRAPGGGRLITPERGGRTGPAGEPSFLPDDSTLGLVGEQQNLAGGPPTLNKYRPPAGFMNETLPDDVTAHMEPQEMLNRLRARAGHWHELAKFMPALTSAGYSATAIDEITGITPLEQNKWVVAATVYESVKASPEISPEVLRCFDGNGADLLHPFRFLSAERRVISAQYVVDQNLQAPVRPGPVFLQVRGRRRSAVAN
jgi:hypothetical protein